MIEICALNLNIFRIDMLAFVKWNVLVETKFIGMNQSCMFQKFFSFMASIVQYLVIELVEKLDIARIHISSNKSK